MGLLVAQNKRVAGEKMECIPVLEAGFNCDVLDKNLRKAKNLPNLQA
jgi:hypothetical protein